MTPSPIIRESCHAIEMCRLRLLLLYCVSTDTLLMPPLTRFDSAKSTNRYVPANGTAQPARSAVSGSRPWPGPYASTSAITRSPSRIRDLGNTLPASLQWASSVASLSRIDRETENHARDRQCIVASARLWQGEGWFSEQVLTPGARPWCEVDSHESQYKLT